MESVQARSDVQNDFILVVKNLGGVFQRIALIILPTRGGDLIVVYALGQHTEYHIQIIHPPLRGKYRLPSSRV